MLQTNSLQQVSQLLVELFPPPYALKEAYSLDRIEKLMDLMGNPQDKLKVVHVAGTSGKTSTCYYVAGLLQAAGKKVGLTVSPHVEQINERVQINLQPLNETDFCKYFTEFINIQGVLDVRPTYFEMMIGFAYWVFAVKEQVDYAVVEVGVGGLGDSTNVISTPSKVCLITDIGMDHMHILGDTIQKITAQKAGIIKPGNAVFMLSQQTEVEGVVKDTASQAGATLSIVGGKPPSFTKIMPPFAARDWLLAKNAYDYLSQRDGLATLSQAQLDNTTTIVVPARMEVFKIGQKTIILDGSHNAQKLAALAAGIKQRFGGSKIAMLTAFVGSRADRVEEGLQQIVPLVSSVIATSIAMETSKQDVMHVSLDPEIVSRACLALGAGDVVVIKDSMEAFNSLLQRPQEVLLVTGSFYLMNQIRPFAHKLQYNEAIQ